MSQSNVLRLAELEREQTEESDACRAPEIILSELEALGSEPDLDAISSLTQELAGALRSEGQMSRATYREKYLQLLQGTISTPARFFDSAMKDAQSSAGGDLGQGGRLTFDGPEPWADPVDGAEILDELAEILRRFVVLPESSLDALALWCMHTYAFEAFWITPRLAITSPEKRCGKSLVLTLLSHLASKPLMSANASPAAIFRTVENVRPTLLIDEADTFLHGKDQLRGILNSGHQKNGCVLRTVGEDYEPRAFATFAPVAIAMIGRLPDTLADRSIPLRMRRKKTSEHVERLRLDRLDFEDSRSRMARWAKDAHALLGNCDPRVPSELHDRAADNWRPLLAIADTAGGTWPTRARSAAVELSASTDDEASARILLLQDLYEIFERDGADKIFSHSLVAELVTREERPWPEWKAGKPLTVRQLARLLQPFGIRPRQIRIGDETRKGYRLQDLDDAFERYVTPPIRNNRNNPCKSKDSSGSTSETPPMDVSDDDPAETPGNMRDVSDVSDQDREVVEL